MKRRFMPPWFLAPSLALAAAMAVAPAQARAQQEEPEMTFDEEEAKKPPAKPGTQPAKQPNQAGQPQPEPGQAQPQPADDEAGVRLGADATATAASRRTELGENRVSWQDIVVVVRKPFLKQQRLEILPMWGTTLNDNMIRHYQFSAQLNYFLTDVLAIGLEGQYYIDDTREPYDLVARQARRLPTVNKYNYGAALNFHYVPIYGKFAILDSHIIHWETFFTAGIGFTQSEVIPQNTEYEAFKNFLITPNVGASMRFFVTKFLTVNAGIRDYVFVDKFEAVGRTEMSGDAAKENAVSELINNVVFQAGLSFWFPTSFDYTTFR